MPGGTFKPIQQGSKGLTNAFLCGRNSAVLTLFACSVCNTRVTRDTRDTRKTFRKQHQVPANARMTKPDGDLIIDVWVAATLLGGAIKQKLYADYRRMAQFKSHQFSNAHHSLVNPLQPTKSYMERSEESGYGEVHCYHRPIDGSGRTLIQHSRTREHAGALRKAVQQLAAKQWKVFLKKPKAGYTGKKS